MMPWAARIRSAVCTELTGEPITVVKCLTQDLMVPAEAEIVIEGSMSLAEVEMEGPFGEFPGYMASRDYKIGRAHV